MAYLILGTAINGRLGQWARLLGLTKPIGDLSSDTLITAWNPDTGANWTVNEIKNDPEWQSRGNADENGETDGYTFEKLRDGEPLSEDNFILTDVENNDFERVAKWLRSKFPQNNGGQFGVEWLWRDGVVFVVNDIGTLPDSNADAQGNYPIYNQQNWIRCDVWERRFNNFDQWYRTYINADPGEAYVESQLVSNNKVSNRGGDDTPFYVFENPPGTELLGLVDPAFVEAGSVEWIRLQR